MDPNATLEIVKEGARRQCELFLLLLCSHRKQKSVNVCGEVLCAQGEKGLSRVERVRCRHLSRGRSYCYRGSISRGAVKTWEDGSYV